ncbi:MAG: hypothetical protein QG635_1573 [Bacteroidota bacterium]|nr:hypothetical protein [Bacteroidota bacterium]
MIDDERISYARLNADTLIDSYLSGRYDVPFAEPPSQLIKKLSIDLTVSNLYDYAFKNSILPVTIIERKSKALQNLKYLQQGMITLAEFQAGTNAPPAIISNKSETVSIFNEDIMNQFMERQ